MVVDLAKIERLEKELREAKAQLWKEDGDRYRILMREMTEADKQRILDNLTDRGERILFGLEAPEEGKRGGGHASRRKRRGSDVRNLREERSDKARTWLCMWSGYTRCR